MSARLKTEQGDSIFMLLMLLGAGIYVAARKPRHIVTDTPRLPPAPRALPAAEVKG